MVVPESCDFFLEIRPSPALAKYPAGQIWLMSVQLQYVQLITVKKLTQLTCRQCNSSYGFLVTVRITVSNFFIFQLQLLLQLTYLTFFSYNYS